MDSTFIKNLVTATEMVYVSYIHNLGSCIVSFLSG